MRNKFFLYICHIINLKIMSKNNQIPLPGIIVVLSMLIATLCFIVYFSITQNKEEKNITPPAAKVIQPEHVLESFEALGELLDSNSYENEINL